MIKNKVMSSWYIYIIRCRDKSLYTGITIDVNRRFQEHDSQGRLCARYLRGRGPLELVFCKMIGDRSLALRVERQIKKLPKFRKEKMIVSGNLIDDIILKCRKVI